MANLLNLGIELRKDLVPHGLQLIDPNGQLGTGSLQPGDVGGQTLGALHDLELDVLEVGLASGQRLDLMMEGLHVLGAPLTGVHPRLVAAAALAHQLHVGLRLDDLALDVAQGRSGTDQSIVQ